MGARLVRHSRFIQRLSIDDVCMYRTKGVTPWDFGDVQPSFREALESSGLDLPRSGRALVPGCGAVRSELQFTLKRLLISE